MPSHDVCQQRAGPPAYTVRLLITPAAMEANHGLRDILGDIEYRNVAFVLCSPAAHHKGVSSRLNQMIF
jgi:hypothetical protein